MRSPASIRAAVRGERAHPATGSASGLSDGSERVHERADREDCVARTCRAVAWRRGEPVALERLAVGLEQAHVVLERRSIRIVAAPSGVVGSGHQVVKRGVTPRLMK